MHDSPTVDDLLAACSPLSSLPRAVEVELRIVILRLREELAGRRRPPVALDDLERDREGVLLYLARRTDRVEDSAPLFVATARRIGRASPSRSADHAARTAQIFRAARSELRNPPRYGALEPDAMALRRALQDVPPVRGGRDPDAAELEWHLRQLISYADPLDAEIVRLVAWERLGGDVIAEMLRISETSVRTRFLHARAVLAGQLRESGDLA